MDEQIEYDIVEDWQLKQLVSQVRRLIAAGWRPLGGIAVSTQLSGSPLYVQAMTRTRPEHIW